MIKRELGAEDGLDEIIRDTGGLLQSHEIKKEPVDDMKDKTITGDLYTSEGLQVSYKDLDQLFDNSDDNSTDETVSCLTCSGVRV